MRRNEYHPIQRVNPLTTPRQERSQFDLILANPPFGGPVERDRLAPDLAGHKPEVLFTDLTLKSLSLGGRAAILVPAGLLFGQNKACQALRRALVDAHRLIAVVALPPGTFQVTPPAGRRRARQGSGLVVYLLLLAAGGQSEAVRFYQLPDLEPPTLAALLAHRPPSDLTWAWTTTRDEIVAADYSLLPNRHKPWAEPEAAPSVEEAWAELKALERQIADTTQDLDTMLAELGYRLPDDVKALKAGDHD